MTFITGTDGYLKELFLTDYRLLDNLIGDRLWSFGDNVNGALGTENTVDSLIPIQTTIPQLNWKSVGFNGFSTAAIRIDGTLWLWGENGDGQLGDNSLLDRSSPVQTNAGSSDWEQVSCGKKHTAAVKSTGTLWCWGLNGNGQLGTNNTTNRSSPVETISAAITWKQVDTGYYHTAAIKTDGTLWSWGFNDQGQLGDNSITHRSSPVQTKAAGTTWSQVACGAKFTIGLKTDGTLWSWGENTNGQLGTNSVTKLSSAVQVVGSPSNWKQVSCGDSHAAAVKIDGSLWTWGLNDLGQLGDTTAIHRSSPIQTISLGNNWKQVSCGGKTTAAIKTDGSLWCWGDNTLGQLGDNTTVNKNSPVQTSLKKNNWKQVSCGKTHTAAVTNGD